MFIRTTLKHAPGLVLGILISGASKEAAGLEKPAAGSGDDVPSGFFRIDVLWVYARS